MTTKTQIEASVKKLLEESKGKKKFKQSIDFIVNFKDVDFKKPENRPVIDVTLPTQARATKICVFADSAVALEAKNANADLVIDSNTLPQYASDKKKQKELDQYFFLATPPMMAVVGKTLGQFLGARGKLPRPIPPNANLKVLIEVSKRAFQLKSKGKYLPVLHCIVGNEEMPIEKIVENVQTVIESIEKKIPEGNVKSIYLKATMGKPVRVI
ncbi:50S ribosomal protein L1 [uncultured archaeon]|nr:50S ribosomal protein L1 [uncultured archaeon]